MGAQPDGAAHVWYRTAVYSACMFHQPLFGRVMSVAAVLAVLFVAAPSTGAQNTAAGPAPKGPAAPPSERTFQRVCGTCHESKRITDTRRSRTQWEIVIEDMTNRGAAGSDQDFDEVLTYLLRHHGSVNVNEARADELVAVLGLDTPEAEAIVHHRTTAGKFADLAALKQVAGVDAKKLDAGRASITY
jgi:competence protein ComEA